MTCRGNGNREKNHTAFPTKLLQTSGTPQELTKRRHHSATQPAGSPEFRVPGSELGGLLLKRNAASSVHPWEMPPRLLMVRSAFARVSNHELAAILRDGANAPPQDEAGAGRSRTKTRLLPPHLVRDVDGELQFGPLLVLGE